MIHDHQAEGRLVATLASVAATAVTSIASDVSSAVGTVQTDVSGLIPKNITFGTTEACVMYTDQADCHSLPLRLSDALHDIPALAKLETAISKMSSSRFEDCVVVGFVFASLVWLSLMLSVYRHVIDPREFGPKHFRWVCSTSLCSAVSCVSFLIPVLAVCTFPSEASKVQLLARRGPVGNYYIVMLSGMVVSTIFLLFMGLINDNKFAVKTEGSANVGLVGVSHGTQDHK
jgi:hypothetical protein